MNLVVASLSVIIKKYTSEVRHNAIFTCGGASVCCQVARSRRPTLPRDAQDWLILIEFPADEHQPGFELDVRLAFRGGDIWNPKAHLKIADMRAADTNNEAVILDRVREWLGQW